MECPMKIVVEINIPLDGAHWEDIPGLYFITTQKIWSITKLHQMRRESFFCNLATATWRCISFYRYEFYIWIYVKTRKNVQKRIRSGNIYTMSSIHWYNYFNNNFRGTLPLMIECSKSEGLEKLNSNFLNKTIFIIKISWFYVNPIIHDVMHSIDNYFAHTFSTYSYLFLFLQFLWCIKLEKNSNKIRQL
jgi:hypothetical protein